MKLWIAQGFGAGRIPFAPGTFGSIIGLLWFYLLLAPGHPLIFVAGTFLGLAISVWLCGFAEKVLNKKDPASVVLDEIAAMPACFGSWVGVYLWKTGTFPAPKYFISHTTWPLTIGVFVAFRLFDIWKPWPVRQSQELPGGWGITVDDLLAAIYVSLLVLILRIWIS